MPDARPILKWAGGKGQLLDRLQPLFPPQLQPLHRTVCRRRRGLLPAVQPGPHRRESPLRKAPAILNDLNAELMTVYQVVRDHLDELSDELGRHQAHVGDIDYYYFIRDMDREPDFAQLPAPVRAARTIFLNKTGYNGLYRVNHSGYFNVPFGRYTHPTVFDRPLLRTVHQALQRVDLTSHDFAQPLRLARKGDFVYVDPPYQPLSRTANFTAYTSRGFDWSEQERLAEWLARIAPRGCYILINNADTPQVREMYQTAFAERGVAITHAIVRDGAQHQQPAQRARRRAGIDGVELLSRASRAECSVVRGNAPVDCRLYEILRSGCSNDAEVSMIELQIPGRGIIELEYAVFDVNGTLAVDGQLIAGIEPLIAQLRDQAGGAPAHRRHARQADRDRSAVEAHRRSPEARRP